MKGIVIYKGKYGATAQYASWLGEALYLPVFDVDRQFVDRMAGCDYVMIGSPVYVGNLLIKDWLKKNQDILHDKKIFLFIVCASAGADVKKQQAILAENLPQTLMANTQAFFLPGRVNIKKLSWVDRLIVRAGAFMEHDPAKKQLMLRGFDGVKREHINKMIKEALRFSNAEVLN